jgi:alpha-galactosidase
MKNQAFSIELVGTEACLWRYTVRSTGRSWDIAPPILELDGHARPAVLTDVHPCRDPLDLPNGTVEHAYAGTLAADPGLALEVVWRVSPASPIVRFQYRLVADAPRTLTECQGRDRLHYLTLSLKGLSCQEIRVSEFDESVHSFRLTEHALPERFFEHGLSAMGPILVAAGGTHAVLVAYEHGSQIPDAFLEFRLGRDGTATLQAVKGNYYSGQVVAPGRPFETLWMQFGCVSGSKERLAGAYRAFVLADMSLNAASRKPYIFYNTWNYQERNKWWNGKAYLDSMHQERILAEIDVAHRMGVEVFVIDTGWYQKTGDWQVDTARFPDGLRAVRERLDRYGMKLGLWFAPAEAAVSSRAAQAHLDCRMSWDGIVAEPRPVWETEESYRMCLVSRYGDAFADELIRLVDELGVTYFKWDGINQYGCNDPHHGHGTAANSPQERADCYAFELGRAMSRVVDRVCRACPEAIVDFDITEGHRSVGLGFLASGKYFLINNGPYYRSLDDPQFAPGGGMGSNVFVFPGPARARICRAALDYDRWIPSVLFLTHYLPDDPASSQMINLASLVLGQNGIWGDLLSVSEEGVGLFGEVLGRYKRVRGDVTASAPVRTGIVGGSPEIHEKISPETGHGVVSILAAAAGRYRYVTAHPAAQPYWASAGVEVTWPAPLLTPTEDRNRAQLDITFDQPGAALVFFGTA